MLTAYSRRCPQVGLHQPHEYQLHVDCTQVGYCQGMNFVAATMLLTCEQPDVAFVVLSYLLEAVVPG